MTKPRTARTKYGVRRHIAELGLPVRLQVVTGEKETPGDFRAFISRKIPGECRSSALKDALRICKDTGGKIIICRWKK